MKCFKHLSIKIKIPFKEISCRVLERISTRRSGISNKFLRPEAKHRRSYPAPAQNQKCSKNRPVEAGCWKEMSSDIYRYLYWIIQFFVTRNVWNICQWNWKLQTEISWRILERTSTTRNGVSNEFPRQETKHQRILSIPTKLLEKSSSWDRLFLRETGRCADKTFIYITCSQAGEASYKIAERNKRGASKGTHGSTRPAASPTSPLNRLVQVVAPGLKR